MFLSLEYTSDIFIFDFPYINFATVLGKSLLIEVDMLFNFIFLSLHSSYSYTFPIDVTIYFVSPLKNDINFNSVINQIIEFGLEHLDEKN